MLRMLRGRHDGRSTLRARVVAAVVVVGLVLLTAPVVAGVTIVSVRWLLNLL